MRNSAKAEIKFNLLIKECAVMVTADDSAPALLEVRHVDGYPVLGFAVGWERLPRVAITPGCYDVDLDVENSVFSVTSIHGSVIRLKFYKPCIA